MIFMKHIGNHVFRNISNVFHVLCWSSQCSAACFFQFLYDFLRKLLICANPVSIETPLNNFRLQDHGKLEISDARNLDFPAFWCKSASNSMELERVRPTRNPSATPGLPGLLGKKLSKCRNIKSTPKWQKNLETISWAQSEAATTGPSTLQQ